MPDPRHAHCPACAGGRVNCPRCDGEGIVETASVGAAISTLAGAVRRAAEFEQATARVETTLQGSRQCPECGWSIPRRLDGCRKKHRVAKLGVSHPDLYRSGGFLCPGSDQPMPAEPERPPAVRQRKPQRLT